MIYWLMRHATELRPVARLLIVLLTLTSLAGEYYSMHPTDKRAFTLTELLLAVVILAVLVVIALPNFQLAATRAKISRVQSDFRTISGALEIYRSDAEAYPPTNDLGTTPSLLSTPVAYLANAVLRDPLFKGDEFNLPNAQNSYLRYNCFVGGDPADVSTAFHLDQYGEYWNYSNPPFAPGGKLIIQADPLVTGLVAYDATNGSVSAGRLIRGQRL